MTKRSILGLVLTLVALPPVTLLALYNLPVRVALGPCLKDWTSPSSYTPRASKLATVSFTVGRIPARLCYGRPSARGRKVFGKLISYGHLWRLGANEPTRLYVAAPVSLAGLPLAAGRYSLYAIPNEDSWEIFVSTSTFHWGNAITPAVRAREVGGVKLPVQTLTEPVETLTIRPTATPVGTTLLIEWETSRIAIPLQPLLDG